ncbi:MAG: hypothetical protein ACJAWL_002886 [Motiliproteus sp.]|jgi:hypothetical protein
MRTTHIVISALLAGAAISPAIAEEHRQQEVHQHGGGSLNVAAEKNSLIIELSVPAMNIVGFEHPPTNQHERDGIERAAALLRDGLQLFTPNPQANCVLVHAEVQSALLANADKHDEKHDEEHDAKHDEHADEEHHDDEENHADFNVAYEFNCAEPGQLSELQLTLFKHFPGTEHLRAQAITATGSAGAELSADNNTLKLR